MAFNKYIQGLSRSGFRFGTTRVKFGTSVQVDLDDRNTQLRLSGWKENFVRTKASGTVTVTSASPAVVSKTGHGFVADDCVVFSSTLTVPTGLTAGTRYFVIAGGLTANAFEVSATRGGAAINTTDTGTGTITVQPASVDIVGIDRRGFRIQDVTGAWTTVKVGSGVKKVDMTVGNTLRVLRRNYGRYIYGLSATNLTIRGIQDKQNGFDTNRTTPGGVDILTSDNTNVSNADTVVIGTDTYTFKTNLTEAFATATVNDTAGTPADGNTVVVNGRTYTFKTALTPSADQVLINGGAGSVTNLSRAINQSGGVPGTDYVAGAANADVTAGAAVGTTITLTAKVLGTAGNALTLARVGANIAVSGATFTGGVNSIAKEVHIGGSADASLTNLVEAINGGANKGTDYSTATVASLIVTATAVAAHATTLTAIQSDADTTALSTTAAHLSFSTADLEEGHDIVYRGQTSHVDATQPFNFRALKRHFRDYIEAD